MTDFEQTYRNTYPKVLAYLRRRTTAPVAEELCSEVFTRAWSGWPPRAAEPLPWLYGIARNVVLEHYRSRPDEVSATAYGVPERRSAQPTVEELVADPAEIYAALAMLSEPDREILQLSAWEGLRPAEIATALQIGVSATRVRLHRARTRLAEQLAALADHDAPTTTAPTSTAPTSTGTEESR